MTREAALITLQGQTMGTDYTVKYIDWADGRALPSPAELKAQIERRLHEVNAEMSTYLPDSTISQFNQLRDDRWFLLPPDFATVLRAAVDLHGITQGGLDVSLGALVNLWGFGPEPRRDSPPPPDAIAARTSGMGQFELAEESGMWFVRDCQGLWRGRGRGCLGGGRHWRFFGGDWRRVVRTRGQSAAATVAGRR